MLASGAPLHRLERASEGENDHGIIKYSSKFNYPKEFDVVRTSGHDGWRTLEISADNTECLKFYISDSGEVIVECNAYDRFVGISSRREGIRTFIFHCRI